MGTAGQLGEWLHANWTESLIAVFAVLCLFDLALGSRKKLPDTGFGRIATNFGLPLVNITILIALPTSLFAIAAMAPQHGPALLADLQLPAWAMLAAVILIRTFVAYWVHRIEHEWPLLWRFHRVHHTDPEMDITTGLRHHPAELFMILAAYGSVLMLLAPPFWAFVTAELVMYGNQLWQHLPLRRPDWLARPLGLVIATPEIHALHHSVRRQEADSNYGALLIIWDRLFGTYTDPLSAGEMRYGLGDGEDARAANLLTQLWLPFMRAGAAR